MHYAQLCIFHAVRHGTAQPTVKYPSPTIIYLSIDHMLSYAYHRAQHVHSLDYETAYLVISAQLMSPGHRALHSCKQRAQHNVRRVRVMRLHARCRYTFSVCSAGAELARAVYTRAD